MQGDFTRFTFDRSKHYNRVLKQQGRVDLDADWNELNDIFEYLDDTTRIDVIGRVGVPIHTPPFFDVTFVSPNLIISAGRIYVDGILVELDANLLIPASAPPGGQKTLVFLDVWDRHITAIEDPHIREIALGGADTCTRVKTEFQVRLEAVGAGVTCANAVPPGASTGRMTAEVVPAPPSDDPCLIAPSGGFRGLENRLYRVEIHQGGALGTATFKWSRDNGSIVFSVTEFPATQTDRVRLSRLGRDQVLTFRSGDWVEVLDDDNELNGTPGTLAQVLAIDETQMELQLTVNPIPSSPPNKHPKVRRWDQPSTAIVTAAGPLSLEDGIQVAFSGTGTPTDFKTGDYWVFAARTAAGSGTGDIEGFTTAPPFGIVHHYASLAVVTWPAGGALPSIEICPPKFPPLTDLPPAGGGEKCCCCTVTVGPDGDVPDIQSAVDTPPTVAAFLIVCLRPNVFTLTAPVTINRDNVIIVGCHERTRVVAPSNNPAFIVRRRTRVAIESMSIQGGIDWAIWSQATRFRVRDCNITEGGIWIADGSANVEISGNELQGGRGPGIALRRLFLGSTVDTTLDIEDVRITRNLITFFGDSGIACGVDEANADNSGFLLNLEISHNQILACASAGARRPYVLTAHEAAGGISLFFAVHPSIHHNRIERCGRTAAACGVIVLSCSGVVDISHNLITNNGRPALETVGVSSYQAGIYSDFVFGTPDGAASLRVVDNSIATPAGPSLLLSAFGSVAISGNRLHSNDMFQQPAPGFIGISVFVSILAGGGSFGPGDGRVRFHDNQVSSRITLPLPPFPNPFNIGGVVSSRCFFFTPDDLAISDNQFMSREGQSVYIHVLAAASVVNPKLQPRTVRLVGNRISDLQDTFAVFAGATSAIITSNQVRGAISPGITAGQTVVANNITI